MALKYRLILHIYQLDLPPAMHGNEKFAARHFPPCFPQSDQFETDWKGVAISWGSGEIQNSFFSSLYCSAPHLRTSSTALAWTRSTRSLGTAWSSTSTPGFVPTRATPRRRCSYLARCRTPRSAASDFHLRSVPLNSHKCFSNSILQVSTFRKHYQTKSYPTLVTVASNISQSIYKS